jgi:hypothetical protein
MSNELMLWLAGEVVLVLVAAAAFIAVRRRAAAPAAGAAEGGLHAVPRAWRMTAMVVASVALSGAVLLIARQQLGILVFKACLLTLAAVIGYWIDRTAFPDTRPHLITDLRLRWRYEWRRAAIVAAALLTAGLGA